MELQERDFEVLAAIERWGAMGLGQVDGLLFHAGVTAEERARLFFNDVRREDYWGRAYKRLSCLEKAGLIRTQRYVHSWPVYLLTFKGHDMLKRRGRAIFASPSYKVSGTLVRHEIMVTAVGLVLTEVIGLRVESARQTWDWMNRKYPNQRHARLAMPDLLVDEVSSRHIVEVELTPKYKRRYAEIFASHGRRLPDQHSRILYLTGWPHGEEFLRRVARESEYGSYVNVASLEDFRATLGHSQFAPSRNQGAFQFKGKQLTENRVAEAVG
jgi:hypothetical protein